jgi:hypothetical protein
VSPHVLCWCSCKVEHDVEVSNKGHDMSHHHVCFEVVHDVAVLHNEHNVSHHVLCCYSLEVVHDVAA